jgi:hypothetical protein
VNKDTQPFPFRRHVKSCTYFGPGGREVRSDKCDCPFHVDGKYRGGRVRQSLDTSNRRLADRRLAALLKRLDEESGSYALPNAPTAKPKTISEAIDRFLKSHGEVDQKIGYSGDIEYSSYRKYRN